MLGKEENFDTANSDNREQRIKNALFWLRNNNRLYKSFYSNYDTLYRFDPDKIIHLHKGSDFEDINNNSLEQQLKGESIGLLMDVNQPEDIPKLDPQVDEIGFQHPIGKLEQSLKDLRDTTRITFNEPDLEAKLWPHLFPFANGGWSPDGDLKPVEYLKHRLLNIDDRWRKDESFSFQWYDKLVKTKLFYVANARRVKRTDRVDDLTSEKLRDDQTNSYYDRLGQVVPATIPGTRVYWNSKLLELLAMTRKLGNPTFFITLTQNDNWPEIQIHIVEGPGHSTTPRNVDSKFVLNDIFPGKDYSVETIEAYSNRLKLFKKKVISNPNGPLGQVIDWWDRKEFQGRGAIHNHMVVWCKEGTVPDNVVCAEVPRGSDGNTMADSLSSYVKHLQIHKCRPDRCNKTTHGKHLDKCKYGFPYPLQDEDGMNKAGNRYLPKRRCPEDTNVVPYNPDILMLWGHT